MLHAQNIRFSHDGKTNVLEAVSISVGPGEVLCLLGPNGTGKSTLLKCLLGTRRPTAGKIDLDGRDMASISARERARKIAYVPQNASSIFSMTAFDLVLMGRNPHLGVTETPSAEDDRFVSHALESMGIAHLRDRLFSELSGGEKQMILIARAITQQANLLVMDEPTSALDYGNQLRILALIKQLAATGRSVIMTTHSPDHAFLVATKVAVLDKGMIVASGPPATVMTAELLSAVYQADIRVAALPAVPGTREAEIIVCAPAVVPSDLSGNYSLPHVTGQQLKGSRS